MTNGEVISRIINDGRFLSKDEHISKRFVLSIAKVSANFLMAQKLGERGLYKESSLFKSIKCFEMGSDNIVSCDIVEFRRCNSLMKSKHKLPKILSGKYGSAIISVTSIDGEIDFKKVSLSKYRINSKRKFSNLVSSNYYYEFDNYLYLPNSNVKSVDLLVIPENEFELDKVSGCKTNDCKSALDYDFICPDRLLKQAIDMSIQEIGNFYKRVIVDENPNMDENQKGKTTL